MKKILLLILIIQFIAVSVLGLPGGDNDRRRFFIMAGTGYASSNPEGALLEAGVEIRLFGDIHARFVVDHYFGNNSTKDNLVLKYAYGASLYAVYKIRISETVDFRLKAGGHYTRARARITALGLTFNTTMADIGFCAGPGFSMQLSNKVYIYVEGAVKHLLLDEPWTWAKVQTGVMYRLR